MKTCHNCGGTGRQQCWYTGMSEGEWEETDCLNKDTTWEDLERAMEIFITCKNKEDHCKGCEYEREEILAMIYHYVENEKRK